MTRTITENFVTNDSLMHEFIPSHFDNILARHPDIFGEKPLVVELGSFVIPFGADLPDGLARKSVRREIVAHCSGDANPWIRLRTFAIEPTGNGLITEEAFQTTHPDAIIAGIVFAGTIRSAEVIVARHARVNGGTLDGKTRLYDAANIYGNAHVINSILSGKSYASDETNLQRSFLSDMARVHNHATVIDSFLSGSSLVRGTSFVIDSALNGNAIISGNVRIAGSTIGGSARINGSPSIVNTSFLDRCCVDGAPRITDSELSGDSLIIQDAKVVGSRLSGNSQVTGSSTVISTVLEGKSAVHDRGIVIGSNLQNTQVCDDTKVRNSNVINQTLRGCISLDGCDVGGGVALSGHVSAIRSRIHNRAIVSEHAHIENSSLLESAQASGNAIVLSSTVKGCSIASAYAKVVRSILSDRSTARGVTEINDSELTDTITRDNARITSSQIINSEISSYANIAGGNIVIDSEIGGSIKITDCLIERSSLFGNLVISRVSVIGKYVLHACDPNNPDDDKLFHVQTEQAFGSTLNPDDHFICERCNGPAYWKSIGGVERSSDRPEL